MKLIYRDDKCVVIATKEMGLVVFVYKPFSGGDTHITIHAICETMQKDYCFPIDGYSIDECVFWKGLTERVIKDSINCQASSENNDVNEINVSIEL